MAQRKSSAGGSGKKAESDIEKQKRAKEREKAAKKRAKERAKQERDVERYRKAAEAARKRAAEERSKQAARENDPVYQEKKRKEAEKLKERGKREMEKQRKRSERRGAAAARSKAKIDEREAQKKNGISSVERKRRQREYADLERRQALAKQKKAGASKSKRNSKSLACLILIIILAIASAIALYPPQDKITMGLDIQGGVSVNLKASTTDGSPITAEQMEQTQLVISNRVNASGAAAATIQQQGSDAFLVQVPGAAENSQAILDTLSSQGVLEFVDVSTITGRDGAQLHQPGSHGHEPQERGRLVYAVHDGRERRERHGRSSAGIGRVRRQSPA